MILPAKAPKQLNYLLSGENTSSSTGVCVMERVVIKSLFPEEMLLLSQKKKKKNGAKNISSVSLVI